MTAPVMVPELRDMDGVLIERGDVVWMGEAPLVVRGPAHYAQGWLVDTDCICSVVARRLTHRVPSRWLVDDVNDAFLIEDPAVRRAISEAVDEARERENRGARR